MSNGLMLDEVEKYFEANSRRKTEVLPVRVSCCAEHGSASIRVVDYSGRTRTTHHSRTNVDYCCCYINLFDDRH